MIKQIKWSYEDYYHLEDDKRYEVIEGELIEMAPSPLSNHQRMLQKLFKKIDSYVEQNNLGEIFIAPLDVIFAQDNVLQPDIIFISKENENIIQERGVFGSPDLVIEILSPSTIKMDQVIKYKLYEKFKVKEYWIVDHIKNTSSVYTLENDKFILSASGENIKSKLLKDFIIDIARLQ